MAFRLIEEQQLPDLQGTGYVYEHDKTKAKICYIKTEDDNKTFSIGFRTPPADDTGLSHILEHSVLCGSHKYPLRDPFIELSKGSLNTFLNAMTFSDKTLYPVASVNNQDFHNLVDVYLDAVFYPNIYDNPLTFEQEGWHYDLDGMDSSVSYKGVVYNEMKGVFSSAEQVLFRKIQQELFENHPYSYESGGDPLEIPKLTQETFLDYHKKYYHPSNSYIFYYGDMDIEQELKWLEESYLNAFDYLDIDSKIPLVTKYKAPRTLEFDYPVSKGEENGNKCYLSYNVLLNESKEVLDGLGFDILEYLMIDAPGALVKEALIKAGIGEDVFSHFDGSIREGTFSIVAKNCKLSDKERFIQIIDEQFSKIIAEGFDQKKVSAAINKFEFRTKEADFGQYPKGVIYAIKTLETWLHDESPFLNFDYDHIFTSVKEATSNGLLQKLIQQYFVENKHKVHLTLKPDENYNDKKQQKISDELKAYEETLTIQDKEALIAHAEKLVAYQEAPQSKEELESLPLLKLEDIPKDKKEFIFNEKMIKDTILLLHEANATNIAYVKCSFDLSFVNEDQLSILSLLSRMLIKTKTKKHSYSELSDEINGRTGGLSVSVSVYEHKKSTKYFSPRLEMTGKCFVPQLQDLMEIIREIILETDFSDVARMRDLINENKSRMQSNLTSSGHSTALLRSESYFSQSASYKEKLRGLEFYDEITLWQNKSDDDLRDLGTLLERLLKDIVSSDRLTIGVTASAKYMETIKSNIEMFVFTLPYIDNIMSPCRVALTEPKNEGLGSTSDVQYVAMSADFKAHGFDYKGSMKVLNTIINLDYLWNNVRIKGGAYGAFSGIGRNGLMYFVSYRDPNLRSTIDVFTNTSSFINDLNLDERELTKYIIGTISPLDQPLTPSLENEKMINLHFSEITHEEILKNRKEILETTLTELKSHKEMYQKIFIERNLCVVGSVNAIEEEKSLFNITKELK